jgi:hypothetical protein
VDVLFDFGSLSNLIAKDMVSKHRLGMHEHPHPYPSRWVNKKIELKVTKQCKHRFATNANFVDKIEVNAVPLDVSCEDLVVLHMRDAIFMRRENQSLVQGW